ncbi:MAG: hypothetical protein HQ594_01610 [Candidatus Omnitrophica bacterium]|nr:hypothetical protein [Candidatus Omnitrophota bacterium]
MAEEYVKSINLEEESADALAGMRDESYQKFNLAFTLMSIIPFLVFFYLLLVKFFNIKILATNTGFVMLLTLMIALLGYCVGFRKVKDILGNVFLYSDQEKEAYQHLKKAQKQLMQSSKMTSVGQLARGLAHEINNPLQVISGLSQMLVKGQLTGEEADENLNVIVEQCQRAKSITGRLLAFSSPGKEKPTEVCINDSLNEVVHLMEYEYSLRRINVVKNLSSTLPVLELNEDQMREVFVNIMKNSAEAMSDGGEMIISTSMEGDNIRIDFADTGEGIEEENMEKIFDPFFSTRETNVGLGLSVCLGILKEYSGKIEYKSKPNKGTVASVYLKIA